jgi:hypothetical protein
MSDRPHPVCSTRVAAACSFLVLLAMIGGVTLWSAGSSAGDCRRGQSPSPDTALPTDCEGQ